MKFSYIIATYAGKDHTSNKDLADVVLSRQIEQFIKLLKIKQFGNVYNHIHEVIIVCPPIEKDNEIISGYYQPDKWRAELDLYCVTLKMLDYVGDNKHHSYDQWIQGWMAASKGSDYCILCEDDYYLDPSNLYIEKMLEVEFRESFPNDIGYLCTMTDSKYHGHHAAISNGVINRATINALGDDALFKFYSIRSSKYSQVNFSHLFLDNGIEIKDFRNHFCVLFWNSFEENIEDYTIDTQTHLHIFIPVQNLY